MIERYARNPFRCIASVLWTMKQHQQCLIYLHLDQPVGRRTKHINPVSPANVANSRPGSMKYYQSTAAVHIIPVLSRVCRSISSFGSPTLFSMRSFIQFSTTMENIMRHLSQVLLSVRSWTSFCRVLCGMWISACGAPQVVRGVHVKHSNYLPARWEGEFSGDFGFE